MSTPPPSILFACVHNAGRSVAAKVLCEHLGAGRVRVHSAGSAPGDGVNPRIAAVLRERGLDASAEVPTLLSPGAVALADVVVTMGCGEECPFVPGRRYLDWTLDDPAEADLNGVRVIVDEIERRVRALLDELGVRVTD